MLPGCLPASADIVGAFESLSGRGDHKSLHRPSFILFLVARTKSGESPTLSDALWTLLVSVRDVQTTRSNTSKQIGQTM
jgi:hypothetical protein